MQESSKINQISQLCKGLVTLATRHRIGSRRLLPLSGAVLALGLIGGSAVGHAESQAPEEPTPEQRAGAAAKAFAGELRNTLLAAMAQGGPQAAVEVCHTEAPRLAATVAEAHGVRIGRVGVRSRQPANRLDGWQKDVLATWTQTPPAGVPGQWAPAVSREDATGTLRWAKAIETEGPCLVCHGDTLEPQLQQAIRARYPDDPATGFAAGSLRGLLWVEVPAPQGSSSRTP